MSDDPMAVALAVGAYLGPRGHDSRPHIAQEGFAEIMGERNPFVGLVKCAQCWRYDDPSEDGLCSDCRLEADR